MSCRFTNLRVEYPLMWTFFLLRVGNGQVSKRTYPNLFALTGIYMAKLVTHCNIIVNWVWTSLRGLLKPGCIGLEKDNQTQSLIVTNDRGCKAKSKSEESLWQISSRKGKTPCLPTISVWCTKLFVSGRIYRYVVTSLIWKIKKLSSSSTVGRGK